MSTIHEKPIAKHSGAFQPQWTLTGAAYHIVLSLADAIPSTILRDWEDGEKMFTGGHFEPDEVRAWRRRRDRQEDSCLDRGYGACLLRRPRCAGLVRDALKVFHRERYHLHAWCIMPNHLHAILEPLPGNELSGIVRRLRFESTQAIGAAVGKTGPIWRREGHEQMLRSPASFERTVGIVLTNPEAAGLRNWTWVSSLEDAYRKTPRWVDGHGAIQGRKAS